MGLAAVPGALERIEAETSVSRLLHALCTELVELVGAQRTLVSRVIGDLIVELSDFDRSVGERPLELFLLSDYPLTAELIASGEPRVVVRADPDADPAEASLLRRLGHESVLLLPLRSRGKNWGLVEIYGSETGFQEEAIETAFALVEAVGEPLAELESTT